MDTALNSVFDNEPFILMRFVIFTLFTRIHKNIKIFTLIFTMFLTLTQIVSFFNMPKLEGDRVFAASIYFYFSISLMCLTFIMDIESLTKSKRRNCWRLDRAGLKLKQDIFKASQTLEVFCLLTFGILIAFFVPYFLSPEFLRRADYSVILVGKYVHNLESICIIYITFFLILNCFMSVCWIVYFLYFSLHVQMQVSMLTKFVRDLGVNLAEEFVMTNCGVAFDGYYQRCIWRDLIFIIQRHTELLSYHRELMRDLNVNITSLLLGTSGICLALSGFWVAIIEQQVRVGTLMPTLLLFLEMLSFSAQACQDKFLAIHDLALEAPWYKWDIRNQKAYLFLIQQSAQVVTYQCFGTRINREFQLQVLKTIYSATNLLVNFYC